MNSGGECRYNTWFTVFISERHGVRCLYIFLVGYLPVQISYSQLLYYLSMRFFRLAVTAAASSSRNGEQQQQQQKRWAAAASSSRNGEQQQQQQQQQRWAAATAVAPLQRKAAACSRRPRATTAVYQLYSVTRLRASSDVPNVLIKNEIQAPGVCCEVA